MRGRGQPDERNTTRGNRDPSRRRRVELGGRRDRDASCRAGNSGFAVVSAKLSEIQSGVMDLVAFVSEHRPVAIVYDLPRPYEANWNFLRLLRESGS